MSVPKGFTPTITLTVPEDIDLTLMDDIVVSFDCNGVKVHKSGTDLNVEAHSIGVALSQEETLSFPEGWYLEAQINWLVDGERGGTAPAIVCKIDRNFYEQEMGESGGNDLTA